MNDSNLNAVNDNLGMLSKQAIEIEKLKQENARLREQLGKAVMIALILAQLKSDTEKASEKANE